MTTTPQDRPTLQPLDAALARFAARNMARTVLRLLAGRPPASRLPVVGGCGVV